MLGSILGAVAGPLISGFFGNKSEKRAEQNNATRIQTTVADAKAAGINPLEAIRGGVASALNYTPRLASATALGQAFDRINDVISGRQAAETATKQVQEELQTIQRDQAKMGTVASPGAGSGVGTGTASPAAPSLVSQTAARAAAPPEPETPQDLSTPAPFEDGPAPLVTNPFHEDTRINVDERWADAEDFEARYGDAASWAYGGLSVFNDMSRHVADRATEIMHPRMVHGEDGMTYGSVGAYERNYRPNLMSAQWVGDFNSADPQTSMPWMGGTTN